ncbi:hypothetical protein LCGC14_2008770 [marine sediment metagenome]|uniref:Uncharacterized protein n=1 Tax=marine sediment metagenome TaxID=412755 RepID=A0A0F9F133_9ZZZZ
MKKLLLTILGLVVFCLLVVLSVLMHYLCDTCVAAFGYPVTMAGIALVALGVFFGIWFGIICR